MNIVKLHATGSTNDELRSRFRESELPHLTTVYTIEQTNGKGQHGSSWVSEKGKNLTFSVLITDLISELTPFLINKVVSVTIVEWLKSELQIPAKIKWPNDILSVENKLAGILIENTFKGEHLIHSIVGIGLNVNQLKFNHLPKAISLQLITGNHYDLEALLISFLTHLEKNMRKPFQIAHLYNNYMFKYGLETNFKTRDRSFKAIVKGTSADGLLVLQENQKEQFYNLKEIQWLY